VPTFETTAAIQSARNVDRWSGVQMSCSATRRRPEVRRSRAGWWAPARPEATPRRD
jgi:hypothetical protein